jgi:hypothetical protein
MPTDHAIIINYNIIIMGTEINPDNTFLEDSVIATIISLFSSPGKVGIH